MRSLVPGRGGAGAGFLVLVLAGVFGAAVVLAEPTPAEAAAPKKKKKPKPDKAPPVTAEPDPPDIPLFPSAPGGKKGAVEILCFTPGADIYVEDKLIGKTPMEKPFPIPAGKYTIKVTKPGFSDYIDVVLIPPGDPTLIEVNLLATSAYVAITSTVPDTQVTIDGTFVGVAPYEGELLVGTHEIRITKLCFKDHIESLEALAGTEYKFDVKMEELPPAFNPCVKKEAIAYTPFYKRAWFLIVVGAAVVGAGVTTGIILSNECFSRTAFGCSNSPFTEITF